MLKFHSIIFACDCSVDMHYQQIRKPRMNNQIFLPEYIPNSPDNKITGYWRSRKDSNESFTKTEYFNTTSYRGLSPCRLCDQPNGNLEIHCNGFTFPEGLFHYLVVHSIAPDHCQEFVNMINNYPVPVHLLQKIDTK